MIPPPDAKEITLACLAHISRAPRGNIGRSGREPAIDWSRLIAFASAHFVLQALPPALEDLGLLSDAPAEAREFLSAVADANAARNAMLRDAVIGIASRLNADGIIPVALKGAAFLLDDASATPAPWRFMGDLDLLVADAELEASVLALRDLGFMPAGNDYDPSSDAHYPPLISPCGTYSVELHTRLFGIDVFGLPVADVRRAAQRVANSAAAILIPTLAHRIVHVLSHAQLHNRNFAIRRLVLKDVLDLSQLVSREADGVVSSEEIFAHFDVLEDRRAAEALVAAWHRCTGVTTRLSVDPIAETWASRAILRLDRPRLRELVELPADILRLEAHRARRERGHWRRRLSLLTDPAKLVQASSNWTGKQRQRLWG